MLSYHSEIFVADYRSQETFRNLFFFYSAWFKTASLWILDIACSNFDFDTEEKSIHSIANKCKKKKKTDTY